MKIFSSTTSRLSSAWVLFLVLAAATTLVGALWLGSHVRPWSGTRTFQGNVYHLQSKDGIVGLVIFSTTPESAAYRQVQMRYGAAEAVAAPLAAGALWLVLRARRRQRRRGFPL